MVDPAVGKCLLKFGAARVGDLGLAEIEISQLRQPLEMHQPSVADLGRVEAYSSQMGHFLEVHQPRVGDTGPLSLTVTPLGRSTVIVPSSFNAKGRMSHHRCVLRYRGCHPLQTLR